MKIIISRNKNLEKNVIHSFTPTQKLVLNGVVTRKCTIIVLIIILSLLVAPTRYTNPVLADVPHNIKLSTNKSGTHTILKITITHDTGAPTSTLRRPSPGRH